MYPSVSTDYLPTPSAPPAPPPRPFVPKFEEPATATADGIPVVHVANANPLVSPPSVPFQTNYLANSHSPVAWSSGLCDCCQDVGTCCLAWWCPCIAFGRIAEIVDRGSTSCGVSGALYTLILCLTGCSCLYSCFYRSKLRGQFYVEESPCPDFCVHCCCEGCALCQEYRELKSQGFDMSIGWHGNMERQKRLASIPPSIEGGMTR